MKIKQKGKDVLFEDDDGEKEILKNCSSVKLMNTLYNKPDTDKYSPDEMDKYGFEIK